jgi:hypothetical protein
MEQITAVKYLNGLQERPLRNKTYCDMTTTSTSAINLKPVKIGLALAILTILFGLVLGALFGLNEDLFQNYIQSGIAANPQLFADAAAEQEKIWRWVQRAHFHAGGIGAFSLGLVILTALTNMGERRKQITATLLGLSIFYPLTWFALFLYAPHMGRTAAHAAFIPELFADIGVGALCLGFLSLIHGLFLQADTPKD